MANEKQMMDMKSTTQAITTAESNEQQRNWSKEFLAQKAEHPLKNYDPTRTHLNFEVTKGGKIQPIDRTKTIDQKMNDILKERSIKNPNGKDSKQPHRILAKFVFGGNRKRMHEVAFGDQKVDLSKGADNSNITRSKDIEKWAVDVYHFAARKYGEENIVSFYVHLDEINPHVHCTVLPIKPNMNRISWTSVFGKNKKEESEAMRKAHTDFFNEVGQKWGLERGSDVKETGAKHRSTAEYERFLVNHVAELEQTVDGLKKQIAKEERKLKSFSTMIENLQNRKAAIEQEIEQIAKQFSEEGADSEQLAERLKKLRKEMDSVSQKLADRQKMLDDTTALLAEAKEKLAKLKDEEAKTFQSVTRLKQEQSQISKKASDGIMNEAKSVYSNIKATYFKMLNDTLSSVFDDDQLSREQKNELEDSGFFDLREDRDKILNCATLLSLNFVTQALMYAESHGGGGGGSSLSGWGRKKDEDDERWWQRCIRQSAEMLKPGRKRSRGR